MRRLSLPFCPPCPRLLFGCCLGALLLASVCGAEPAQGQGAVRGTVVEADSERPLPGATVAATRIVGANRSATTEATRTVAVERTVVADGDGLFELRRLPPGRYAVEVRFVGFERLRDTLAVEVDAVTTVRYRLTAATETLDDLVVEAEGATGLAAVEAGVQRARPLDLALLPVPGASGDLAAFVTAIPGVTAIGDRGGRLYVQGGAPTQNLTRIDGLPLYRPFHIVGFYSAFPLEMIDDAEVSTGGFGVRDGGRLSSVIGVQARRGSKERFAGGAALAPFLSGVHAEGPLVPGAVSVLTVVRESLVDRLMPSLYGQRFPYRFGDRFGKVHATLGGGLSASATALHTYDDGDVAGTKRYLFGRRIPIDVEAGEERARWENTVLGGEVRYAPLLLPIRVTVQGGTTGFSNRFTPSDTTRQDAEVDEWHLNTEARLFRGPGELRLGAFWTEGTYRYDIGTLFANAAASTVEARTWGGYLGLLGPVGPVDVEAGLRMQRYEPAAATSWEPRLRLAWQTGWPFARTVSAAAGVYRQGVVGLSDERNVGSSFTAWVPVEEGQPLPVAYHVLGSVQSTPHPTTDIAVEAFYKAFPDLLVPTFEPLVTASATLEEAEGTALGINLRVETRQPFAYDSELTLTGHYTLSDVTYETARERYAPPHDQRHRVYLLARAERDGYALTARWQYGSGYPFTRATGINDFIPYADPDVDITQTPGTPQLRYAERGGARLPSYHRLDLFAERVVEQERWRVTLRVGAYNVYNRANVFYFDLLTFRRVDQFPLLPTIGMKLEAR